MSFYIDFICFILGERGKGGEIFILDMSKPIRIFDLASETIKLSVCSRTLHLDCFYRSVHLSEKMVEELDTNKKRLSKTVHPKFFFDETIAYSSSIVYRMLAEIKNLCLSQDDA